MEKVRPWCGQPSDRGRLKNRNRTVMTYKVRFYKKLAYGANSVMSDLFYVHLMDTDYVAECLTVFHGNGAAIDRIRTDFTCGCRPSTY